MEPVERVPHAVVGTGGGAADLVGATAADATHIATGWIADETVTDGLCRIVKR